MNRFALFVLCLALASTSASVPAEPATQDDLLDLLDASLTAGEGVPAQVLLEQYLLNYPRTPRVLELEVLQIRLDQYIGPFRGPLIFQPFSGVVQLLR